MATLPPSLIAGVDFDPGEEVLRHLDDFNPAAVVGDVLNMASVGGSEASMHEGDEALPPAAGIVATVDGVSGAHGVPTMVQGAVERRKCVEAKMFTNGGFRSSSVVGKMLPRGGAGLKNKVPKRKDYGAEGADGDEAHAAAMKEFSIADFGGDHVQGLTFERRMGFVGLYGWWLELNHYGKYVVWQVSDGARVALERDSGPRTPTI
jgi:hypothetical protein